MQISDEISAKIAKLGFIFSLCVVCIHAFVAKEVGTQLWWFSEFTKNGICRIAVPFYFAVSGYLLAGHADDFGWYKVQLKKRLWTLGVPFIVWCILWFMFEIPSIVCGGVQFFSGWSTLRWLGLYPFDRPALFPLWYVRALIVLVVLAPLLVWAIRRLGQWTPVGLFFMWFFLGMFVHGRWSVFFDQILPLRGSGGAFFFAVGIWFRLKNVRMQLSRLWCALFLVCSAFFMVLKSYCVLYSVDVLALGCQMIFVPLLLVAVWGMTSSCRWPKIVTSCAFPVFLMHIFALVLVSRLVKTRISNEIFLAIALTFLCFGVTFAFALILHKYAPKSLIAVLFGGR